MILTDSSSGSFVEEQETAMIYAPSIYANSQRQRIPRCLFVESRVAHHIWKKWRAAAIPAVFLGTSNQHLSCTFLQAMDARNLTSLLRGGSTRLPRTLWRNGWICRSCRQNTLRYSSSNMDKKPYYITTPIFYVNAGKSVSLYLLSFSMRPTIIPSPFLCTKLWRYRNWPAFDSYETIPRLLVRQC